MHGSGWAKLQKAFDSQSGQILGAGLAVCRLITGPREVEVDGGENWHEARSSDRLKRAASIGPTIRRLSGSVSGEQSSHAGVGTRCDAMARLMRLSACDCLEPTRPRPQPCYGPLTIHPRNADRWEPGGRIDREKKLWSAGPSLGRIMSRPTTEKTLCVSSWPSFFPSSPSSRSAARSQASSVCSCRLPSSAGFRRRSGPCMRSVSTRRIARSKRR